jgi:hypothetical protein
VQHLFISCLLQGYCIVLYASTWWGMSGDISTGWVDVPAMLFSFLTFPF